MNEWKKKFLENASTEAVQKNFQKVVEWYGSKDIQVAQDSIYGEGTTEFIGQAMKAFYQKK